MMLNLKLIKSLNGRNYKQILIAKTLGLKSIGQSKQVFGSPQIKGMIFKIQHLLEVKRVEE